MSSLPSLPPEAMLRTSLSSALRAASSRLMSTVHIQIGLSTPKNKVNSLGLETRKCLMSQIDKAVAGDATALVLSGAKTFSAGADIAEFAAGGSGASPSLHDLIDRIEGLDIPTVAAISGVALGGGLELALSCKYRVAQSAARVGLPEVHLGIIPGAGGTQRMPRAAGVQFALGAITTGRMIGAKEALDNDLLDGISDGEGEDFLAFSTSFADEKKAEKPEVLACRNLSKAVCIPDEDAIAFAKKKLPPLHMGGEAAHGCVDAVAAAFMHPTAARLSTFQEGSDREAEIFLDLLKNSSQGRARRHGFFAERFATSPPPGAPPATSPLGNTVGVIGAGTMGSGIATCFLRAGYTVTLVDVDPEGLARGEKTLARNIETDVKKGRASEEKAGKQMASFKGSTTLESLKDCDMIVEAVFESLELKKKVREWFR